MSKLNPAGKPTLNSGHVKGTSFNGNPQWVKKPSQQLYELTVSTMYGNDKFYETGNETLARTDEAIMHCVANNQLSFVHNLVVYARREMKIRTYPIIVTVLFLNQLRLQNKSYEHARAMVFDVIQRADQVTDMLACALKVFGSKNKIPMALRRGIGDAMNKFSEYSIAKYSRDTEVTFRDVLRIVHPTPKDAVQGEIFAKIMSDALETPYTWETVLSKNGQMTGPEKKSAAEIWTEILDTPIEAWVLSNDKESVEL